jgi:hypothetical protein
VIGLVNFVAGAGAAIATGYFTDYIKAAAPPGEAADKSSSESAIRATILQERLQSQQGELWVFPYRLSTKPLLLNLVLNGFKSEDERIRSFYREGAVDVNLTRMKLIVEGRRNLGVRIVDMRAQVLKRSAPLSGGTVLTPGPQGAGESAVIGFDLDSTDLSALSIDDKPEADAYSDDFFGEHYFQRNTVSLLRNEQQVFQITARTVKHYVEWQIDIVVLEEGQEKTYTVGISENPVKTTSSVHEDTGHMDSAAIPDETQYAEVYIENHFSGSTDTPIEANSAVFVRTK